MIVTDTIEQQARYLANYGREVEPGIVKVYWFPAQEEIRLISLYPDMPASEDEHLAPFYFKPSPEDGITFWSAVAMIQPSEFGNLELPKEWGAWNDAIAI
jgi:hypothetical protein